MNVLRGTILWCFCAIAAAAQNGVWSANRMPGTNLLWTAEKSSQEVANVSGRVAALSNTVALVTPTSLGVLTAAQTTNAADNAVAISKIKRLFDSTGTRWIDGTGGVFQVVQTARPETQMTLTFSADFATSASHAPAQRVHLFDDTQSTFRYLACGGSHSSPNVKWTIEVVGLWGYGIVTLKHWNEANAVDFTATCNTRDVGGNRIRPASFGAATGSTAPYSGTIVFDDIDGYIYSTNALPRVAFASDIPSTDGLLATNGDGSHLTGISAAQVGAADSNYVAEVVYSNTPPRAWMPLTTQSAYGYADLPCASNSFVLLGPAPLNSFVIRPLILTAYNGSAWTFSNIVFYCDRTVADPRQNQGFASVTTGTFTVSNWGLQSPKGYVMRRTDASTSYGMSRRNIGAYSLGIAGSIVRLMCLWSPATDAELADADGIIDYGDDAR